MERGIPSSLLNSSWVDGIAFCKLVNAKVPGSFDVVKSSDEVNSQDEADEKAEAIKNMKKAFEIAEQKLDIPQLLDADLLVENPDDLSIMTYISYFRNKDKVEQELDILKTELKGSALTDSLTTGNPTQFEIYPRYADGTPCEKGIPVSLQLKNDKGYSLDVPVNDEGSGKHVAPWTPSEAGDFTVHVTVNNTPLENTPTVHVVRTVKPLDHSKSSLRGPNGAQSIECVKGESVTLFLTAIDTDGFPLSGLTPHLDLWEGSTPMTTDVDEEAAGEYRLVARPSPKGTELSSALNGTQLPWKLPLQMIGMDPGKSSVFLEIFSRTFLAKLAEEVVLLVELRDSTGKRMEPSDDVKLSVEVTPPSRDGVEAKEVTPTVSSREDGFLEAKFVPQDEGDYSVRVSLSGEPVQRSPFTCKVLEASKFGFDWENELQKQLHEAEQSLKDKENEIVSLVEKHEDEKKVT